MVIVTSVEAQNRFDVADDAERNILRWFVLFAYCVVSNDSTG